MKKLLVVISLAVLSASCAPAPITVDSGLQPYLDKFKQDGAQYGFTFDYPRGLTMKFVPMSEIAGGSSAGTTIGECSSGTDSVPLVRIGQEFWTGADSFTREALVYHELGHCLLYRGHDTNILPSGIPESIMYPSILNSSVYSSNRAYYIRELFTNN